MSEWKNEDDIKADLRTLTQELRKLREELRGMVSHPKPSQAGAILHRQSWPTTTPNEPVDEAADSTDKRRKKPQKK